MYSQGPTPREVVLALLCLIAVLYLSSSTPSHHALSTVPAPAHEHDPPPFSALKNIEGPSARHWETHLAWDSGSVPTTKLVAHTPGWTIFDRLYVFQGVLYIVTDEPKTLPPVDAMISNGEWILAGREAEIARLPTENDLKVISTREARHLFGARAQVMDGVSFLCNDPPQFVTHYYHWSAELWYGFWRTYSSLDPSINASGYASLPPPKRLIFNRMDNNHWRDYAWMNQEVLYSSFPSMTLEFIDDWRDRAAMGPPVVFDRVVLADRSASMPAYNYQRFQRTAAVPFGLPGSPDWWMTIRNNVVQMAGSEPDLTAAALKTPVITYISRQSWGRRMLLPDHHERLVQELYRLRETYGYEVNIVEGEKLTRKEQIQLASRTTIMMGVHGNGLTSLLWMKPTPRSTVIEFFYPGGFAHDYEYTTRAMGMKHFGFWGSAYFTSPGFPLPAYPEGFQGNEIPIDGAVVARLVHDRLTLAEEIDD